MAILRLLFGSKGHFVGMLGLLPQKEIPIIHQHFIKIHITRGGHDMACFRNCVFATVFLIAFSSVSGIAEAKWTPVSSTVSDIATVQESRCIFRLRYLYANFGIPHELTFDLASLDETLGGPDGEPSEQVFQFHAAFGEIRTVGFKGGFIDGIGYNDYVTNLSNADQRPFSEKIRLILNESGFLQVDFGYYWSNVAADGAIYGTTLLLDPSFFILDVDCRAKSRKK